MFYDLYSYEVERVEFNVSKVIPFSSILDWTYSLFETIDNCSFFSGIISSSLLINVYSLLEATYKVSFCEYGF